MKVTGTTSVTSKSSEYLNVKITSKSHLRRMIDKSKNIQ